MRNITLYFLGNAVLILGSAAHADTFAFDTDPFAGVADVRNIPGRQIVGGEQFIGFSPAKDVFSFDAAAAVPEPSGLALFLPVLGLCIYLTRSKRRNLRVHASESSMV